MTERIAANIRALIISPPHADLEEVAVAAKPFLGGSAPSFRRPAKLDVTQYEQQCATALAKALARPGVQAVLEAVKDG